MASALLLVCEPAWSAPASLGPCRSSALQAAVLAIPAIAGPIAVYLYDWFVTRNLSAGEEIGRVHDEKH